MIRKLIRKWHNKKQIAELKNRRQSWRDFRDHSLKESYKAHARQDPVLQARHNSEAYGASRVIHQLSKQIEELS